MSIINKLTALNLPSDAVVSLSYSEGTDVFVHNETEIETALESTDVVTMVSELVATPGLLVRTSYGSNVLSHFRDLDLLEEYSRDGTFSDYLAEMINDNFYDVEVIESSIEKYDHKRGYCSLTASFEVDLQNLLETQPFISGWTIQVKTPAGTLTLD